jgi:S-adenosylmethionine hydrolase
MTLTTDYGYGTGFVGTLHAVAFGIAPQLRVIDLDHSVPPQDVRLGALRLERFMRVAPAGVHVGVVDPGVGGNRRAIAITAGSHAFVGPDNGLLVWAAEACGAPETRVVVLDRAEHWLENRTRTFDGRDIFVPVGAHLAQGVDIGDLGTETTPESLRRLSRPRARIADGIAELEVLQVDGFGNVQLSGDEATAAALGLQPGDSVEIRTEAGVVGATYALTFAEVAEGGVVVLVDSDRCLAISVNCGRADVLLGETIGRAVTLRRR